VVEFFRLAWSLERRRPLGLPDYTSDETHEVLIDYLGYTEEGPLERRVRKHTRNMSRSEFHQLTQDAKELAWHLYKARLPEPGEGKDGL
jgi:hypothetical protein